jgi:hypothetical protein
LRSYLKLYGPPLLKAIKALEKVAVDMPDICIMDTFIEKSYPTLETEENVMNYFGVDDISTDRCRNIISRSGGRLGDADFFFEWFSEPSINQLNLLIEKIDEALMPLGVSYTIATK